MVDSLLQLVVAPTLVGASTLAARRWGERTGGLVSAFPAIVGPVLFIAAREHGPAFAARAASGTLLGLVALSGFALACGWAAALRAGWLVSLAAGWVVAAGIAAFLAGVEAGPVLGLAAASLSLLVAQRALPRRAHPVGGGPAPAWDLPLRLALTAVLVVSLSAAASALGAAMGGVLAALPVLASILAAFTHCQQGPSPLSPCCAGCSPGWRASWSSVSPSRRWSSAWVPGRPSRQPRSPRSPSTRPPPAVRRAPPATSRPEVDVGEDLPCADRAAMGVGDIVGADGLEAQCGRCRTTGIHFGHCSRASPCSRP
jgi:hypothetical protein